MDENELQELKQEVNELCSMLGHFPEISRDIIEGMRRYFVEGSPSILCSYCGLLIDNSDPQKAHAEMMQHVRGCEANPLVAEVTRLRAALEQVEWVVSGDLETGYSFCPWCGKTKGWGHAHNCPRQAALS